MSNLQMNFHLNSGIYFRRIGDDLVIVRAKDSDDPGEVIVKTDVNGFASVVASFSPHQEANGSFAYAFQFLKDGVMYCCGCGNKLTPAIPGGGALGVLNAPVCMPCCNSKFKPIFDSYSGARK